VQTTCTAPNAPFFGFYFALTFTQGAHNEQNRDLRVTVLVALGPLGQEAKPQIEVTIGSATSWPRSAAQALLDCCALADTTLRAATA